MARDTVRRDLALVRACLRGDSCAWGALFARIARVARTVLNDRADVAGLSADDLAAEVTLRLLKNRSAGLRSYRGRGHLDAWLLSILRNMVVDVLRSSSSRLWREAADVVDETLARVPCPGPNVETLAMARAMLAELPPVWREVVELRELEGLSYREIASQLGITPSAARQRHRRALEHLHHR